MFLPSFRLFNILQSQAQLKENRTTGITLRDFCSSPISLSYERRVIINLPYKTLDYVSSLTMFSKNVGLWLNPSPFNLFDLSLAVCNPFLNTLGLSLSLPQVMAGHRLSTASRRFNSSTQLKLRSKSRRASWHRGPSSRGFYNTSPLGLNGPHWSLYKTAKLGSYEMVGSIYPPSFNKRAHSHFLAGGGSSEPLFNYTKRWRRKRRSGYRAADVVHSAHGFSLRVRALSYLTGSLLKSNFGNSLVAHLPMNKDRYYSLRPSKSKAYGLKSRQDPHLFLSTSSTVVKRSSSICSFFDFFLANFSHKHTNVPGTFFKKTQGTLRGSYLPGPSRYSWSQDYSCDGETPTRLPATISNLYPYIFTKVLGPVNRSGYSVDSLRFRTTDFIDPAKGSLNLKFRLPLSLSCELIPRLGSFTSPNPARLAPALPLWSSVRALTGFRPKWDAGRPFALGRGKVYVKDRTRVLLRRAGGFILSTKIRSNRGIGNVNLNPSRVLPLLGILDSSEMLLSYENQQTQSRGSGSTCVGLSGTHLLDSLILSVRRVNWSRSFQRQSFASVTTLRGRSGLSLFESRLSTWVSRRSRSHVKGLGYTGVFLPQGLLSLPNTSYLKAHSATRRYSFYKPSLHPNAQKRFLDENCDPSLQFLRRRYFGKKVRLFSLIKGFAGSMHLSPTLRPLWVNWARSWVSRFTVLKPIRFQFLCFEKKFDEARTVRRYSAPGSSTLRSSFTRRSSNNPLTATIHKVLFRPQVSQFFVRNSFFASYFLLFSRSLPSVDTSLYSSFSHNEPYDFVNYKQVKKDVFRRLLSQKHRLDRYLLSRRSSKVFDSNEYGRDYSLPLPTESVVHPLHLSSFLRSPRTYMIGRNFSQYRHFGNSTSFNRLPHVRKTRYKPGYQRMWRHERRIIKQVTSLTNRYQYRLTTKLQLLYFHERKVRSPAVHLRLDHSLILCHLVPDNFTAKTLLLRRYVYLNGKTVESGSVGLAVNDFIQLVVNLRFYVLTKWLQSWSISRFAAWMRRFYRTYRVKRQLFREFKFRSLPDSVMELQNSWYDIPKLYEVDFFTLSTLVLFPDLSTSSLFTRHVNSLSIRIFNMYNWKYLT